MYYFPISILGGAQQLFEPFKVNRYLVYSLSAAYDMLSTNVILSADTEQLALSVNGKKRNIYRKDFRIFAQNIGISNASAEKMIDKIVKMKGKYLIMCRESYLPDEMKASFENLIENRILALI